MGRRPGSHIRNPLRGPVSSQVSSWFNFTPLSLVPSLWLDASDTATITESGGAVSQWDDKSGNGFHVTQGTAANQPTTGTSTIKGFNAISFDGNDSLNRTTNSQLASAVDGTFTAFAVFRSNNVASDYGVISQDGGAGGTRMPQMIRHSGSQVQTVRIIGGVFVDSAGRAISNSTTYVAASMHKTNSIEAWVDGFSNGSTSTTGTNGTSAATIRVGSATDIAGFFAGLIAEIFVTDRLLTSGEMNAMGYYLAAKWGGVWTAT